MLLLVLLFIVTDVVANSIQIYGLFCNRDAPHPNKKDRQVETVELLLCVVARTTSQSSASMLVRDDIGWSVCLLG
jgi:hypothetical protein